jgi:hypothetical protein
VLEVEDSRIDSVSERAFNPQKGASVWATVMTKFTMPDFQRFLTLDCVGSRTGAVFRRWSLSVPSLSSDGASLAPP